MTPVKTPVKHFEDVPEPTDMMKQEVAVENGDEAIVNIQNIQVISLETTTRNTASNVKKSFLMSESRAKSKRSKSKFANKHTDGKRSVGLKSSLLKRRISKKAMSAKTSVKKFALKSRNGGKMSVKFISKKKKDHMKSLNINLKSKSIRKGKKSTGKGYITPCKPTLKGIKPVDLEDCKSYLGHTAQSKNRAMSRFADIPEVIEKSIEKGPTGKKKLIEPKGFKLRAEARCKERKRLRDAREKRRHEKILLEK